MSAGPAIRLGLAEDVARVEALWEALYVNQQQQGMVLPVPKDGFSAWAKSLAAIVGRFGCLVLAEVDGKPVGFVAGRTRNIPQWFGGGTTGFVSDVFVDENFRGQGLSRHLMTQALEWFTAQGIRRVELQVIMQNEAARAAYKQMGFADELVQMVWAAKEH